jgi:alkylation response protein AidB-like acyl-CoA dehydrogenase
VAPFAAEIDRQPLCLEQGEVVVPPRLTTIFGKLGELDLHGLNLPRELGGMNAPMLLYFINSELLARADVSVMAHHGFHGGTAMALLVMSLLEGTTEIEPGSGRILSSRFQREIAEVAAGRAWGSMDITEPDAGSDMAALRAVARQDADGTWFLTGNKIFITSGHGKFHVVIARTEDPTGDPNDPLSGLKGLSLFVVPAWETDAGGNRVRHVAVDRLEEKLGHHASATCSVTFEDAPAQLVGQRGEGFSNPRSRSGTVQRGHYLESFPYCPEPASDGRFANDDE